MTRQDRLEYHDQTVNRIRVNAYVERLLKAEAIAFSFPVWNMGFPAILKGFVDKVFLPGVSFNLKDDGSYVPCLHNIKRLGAVCTYGGARWTTFLMGDPPRELHGVGYHDHRQTVTGQVRDDGKHFRCHPRIERARRLVKEDRLRLHRQRSSDCHSLLLPAG